MEHFVITVARETGSGGHDITRKLSQQLGEDGCVELIRRLLPLFT